MTPGSSPGHAAAELLDRGTALRLEGRLSEAIRLLDEAARLTPGDADIWLERAIVFDLGGSLANARASYAEAARLVGGGLALAGVASVAARQNDHAAAREAGEAALRLCPGEPTATIALARCELEASEFAVVEARLRALLADDIPTDAREIATGLLGDALDKLDRPAEAFTAFTQSKALFAAQWGSGATGQPTYADSIDAIGKAFAAILPDSWHAPAEPIEGAAGTHIFLLGHPRSGTTLVENILASAGGVEAIEERPTMRDAELAFFDPPARLADFAALDAAALQPFRDAYWQRVRQNGATTSPQTLVDMDPFKGSRLPLIARLFPDAKIIVMRRDPRDVVMSCFRTNFAPSPAALQFATLEGAARHYDALMRVQQACIATLPLAFHELRYEALVADFDATTRALCTFAGIAWSDDLRRFDRTAERRGVATASRSQVRRGLYDGRAQWRRYEAQLAPVMPILEPWIEEFGYAGTP